MGLRISAPQLSEEDKAIRQAQLDLLAQSRAAQAAQLEKQAASLEALRGREAQVDLTPLMALADAWSGSNLAGSYKKPKTKEQMDVEAATLENALTEGKLGLSKLDLDTLKALKPEQQSLSVADQIALANLGMKLTPGQEAFAKEAGGEYAKWNMGGKSTVQKNLDYLESGLKELSELEKVSDKAPLSGSLPGAVRAITDQKGFELQSKIQDAAYSSLKEILPGSASDSDVRLIAQTAYDPRLSPSANKVKVKAFIDDLKRRIQMKETTGQQVLEGKPTAPKSSVSVTEDEIMNSPEVQAVLKKGK